MKILANSMMADPMACDRKYLMAPSVSWFVLVEHMSGINLRRLISMAVQARTQFVLDTAIIVLRIIEHVAMIDIGEDRIIKIWRSRTPG